MKLKKNSEIAMRSPMLEQVEDRLYFAADIATTSAPVDFTVAPLSIPDDQVNGISIRENYGWDGAGQTVVIIDSGIAYDHYALGGGFGSGYRVVGGWDFAENDADPFDDAPGGLHGTHIAGIIGSDDVEHPGLATAVDLVALRVFDDRGYSELRWLEQALTWVEENQFAFESPITTVNLSVAYNTVSHSGNISALDDELARLEEAGIFVAVAAGNSFDVSAPLQTAYPASNPSVVAVSSVNANGSLSSFSQRSPGILAAPGERIISTAPDYLFDFNGITDDFVSASGTSMAAPYVAGASVLVRQALEANGTTSINQDTIYRHLVDTADVIYDATTNQSFHRINLGRALEQLVPPDDYDSTPEPPTLISVPQRNSPTRISGTWEPHGDVETYQFVAPNSGILQIESSASAFNDEWRWIVDGTPSAGRSLEVLLQAGETYTFGVDSNRSGEYSMSVTWHDVTANLGTTSYVDLRTAASGGDLYRLTAANQGWLTIVAMNEDSQSELNITLYDDSGHVIQERHSVNSTVELRLDHVVSQNQSVFVRVESPVRTNVQIVNQVAVTGNRTKLIGSRIQDDFAIDLNTNQVSVNNVAYSLASSVVDVMGSDGRDSLRVSSSATQDRITLSPNQMTFQSPSTRINGSGLFSIYVDGRGGNDRVDFRDSPGNDQLRTTSTYARMMSETYYNMVENVADVFAVSTFGIDRSQMYDSPGDDRFVSTADYVSMQGDDYLRHATGFAQSYAYANGTGRNRAYLYDSAGDERVLMTPDFVRLNGAERFVWAENFGASYAYSLLGGTDQIEMVGSNQSDTYVATPQQSRLFGQDYYLSATGFDTTYAEGKGGIDEARMSDTPGDDHVLTEPGMARVMSVGYYNRANGFETIRITSGGQGIDRVFMHDSPGDDWFVGTPDFAEMHGTDYQSVVEGFARVFAYAEAGGRDQVWLLDSEQDDLYVQTDSWAVMKGSDFWNYTQGFEQIRADATMGNDEIRLYCDEIAGQVNLTPDRTRYEIAAQVSELTGFDSLVGFRNGRRSIDVDLENVDNAFESFDI